MTTVAAARASRAGEKPWHGRCSAAGRMRFAPTLLVSALAGCVGSGDVGYDLDATETGSATAVDVCDGFAGGELRGDDLLVLVNKEPARQLASDDAPDDLVVLATDYRMPGREGFLRRAAADALYEMIDTARVEIGVALGVRSAYRSFRDQCATYRAKVEEHGPEHAARYSAVPGRSQHQLGTTVDLTSQDLGWALSTSMGASGEGEWLSGNAHRFGFSLSYPPGAEEISGYAHEPWHFRYIGLQAAAELQASGLVQDEYLSACGDGDERFACPREQPRDRPHNRGFIGGLCATDADCASIGAGAFCLGVGTPAAACTLPCTTTCPDRPGSNAHTFCVAAGDTAGLCHSRCDQELFAGTGCPPTHQCVVASRPASTTTADVCLAR